MAEVWPLLLAKLEREPVEDLRIDLEDGYRGHSDDEEDAHAVAAVAALAGAGAPPYWGVRFKCFEAATRARGLRTLDLVLGAALDAGPLPDGFRLTLPKVTSVEQVLAMAEACTRLEAAYGLDAGRLRFEVQVETRAGGPRPGRHGDRGPAGPRRARAAATGCTSAPTTTPPRSASPPPTRRWTTRSPTTRRT